MNKQTMVSVANAIKSGTSAQHESIAIYAAFGNMITAALKDESGGMTVTFVNGGTATEYLLTPSGYVFPLQDFTPRVEELTN